MPLHRLIVNVFSLFTNLKFSRTIPHLDLHEHHLFDKMLLYVSAFICKEMDTTNPAVIVNGDLLRSYVGRKVRTVIQVIRPDAGGLIGRSTDEKQITIKGQPPSPLTTFVEVIGVADSALSIRAEIVTNFGDTFDTNNYNQLCQLANGEFRHLFI
ncbi:hypothetical protein LXL04_018360 [Taraxacum kok-saghyz]